MFLYFFLIWVVNLWYSIVWDLINGFIKKLLKGCHKKEQFIEVMIFEKPEDKAYLDFM